MPNEQEGADTLSPGRFIRELWGIVPRDWIAEFLLIRYQPTVEDRDAKSTPSMFWPVGQVLDDWTTVEAALQHQNRTKVYNVHPCVNPRFRRPKGKGGKNSDVSHYVSLWVDVDFKGNEVAIRKQFSETVEDLGKLDLGPSIIVESGYGLHAYWLFDKPYPAAESRQACAGIMDYFKIGDPIHDPRRVLRMPGTVNLKDSKHPALCRVVEATYARYPLEAFDEYRIEPGKSKEDVEEEEVEKAVRQTPTSRDPKIEEAKNGVSESGGPYGGRTNAATALAGHYCSKLRGKKLVLYAMHAWNKLNKPPLHDEEIETIIGNIWNLEQLKKAEKASEKADVREQRKPSALWFTEDGDFIPAIMAQYLSKENIFMSTPIGRDGRGIDLYIYKDGVYTQDGSAFARSEVRRLLGAAARVSRINEVVELLVEQTKLDYQMVNRNAKKMINVRNGMLDWKTGELKPHDPKLHSLIQLNVEYSENAKSRELDAFLDGIFPKDCIPMVEEFIGYLMIPDTSLQKAFIAIGAGGNGKGTFLKILKEFLGVKNVSSISLHQIEEDRFSVSNLFGKLANIYHDLDPRILESTGKFKSIVTGDPIGAEQKFKDHYTFEPYCRLLFSANDFPRSNDRTEAYFDRLIFVRFPKRYRGTSEQVLDYDQVLVQTPGVLPALLVRALSGLRRLMENRKFSDSETSSHAVEEYRRECSNAYDFVREFCRHDPNGWIDRKSLYEKYVGWCEGEGMKPMSAKNFAKSVREFGAKDGKREGTRGWAGIDWVKDAPTTVREEIGNLGAPERQENLGF